MAFRAIVNIRILIDNEFSLKIKSGTTFCQVEIKVRAHQFLLLKTEGIHMWNGNIPSFKNILKNKIV